MATKTTVSRGKRLAIIITSAVLAAVIITGFVIGLIYTINKNKTLDYMKDDLSRYVTISAEDYKNFPVKSLLLAEPTAADVAREVNKLLVANKSEKPKHDGAAVNFPSYTLKIGDELNLWYCGYVIEDGIRKNLENMSNFGEGKPHSLDLGAGTFISDLEDALIGMNFTSTDLDKIKEGTIAEDDIIYVTYNAFHPDGTYANNVSERIDLSADYIDKIYGNGFKEYFVGKKIGEKLTEAVTFRVEGEAVDTGYYDIFVDFVTRCEDKAVNIPVTFPVDYREVSLRGKAVTFEVFAYNAIMYETPAWSDSFITDTLKVSADELKDYEGASLTAKYEAKIMAELIDSTKEKNSVLIEADMWDHLLEKASFKKLPEAEVTSIYQSYYSEIQSQYQLYSNYYPTIDSFAIAYLGLAQNADWRAHITAQAEDVIREKLVFYYIVQEERLDPSDEEFEKLYSENIEEHFDYYKELNKTELDACKTDEERQKKLDEIRKEMMDYYGESYFDENTRYQYAIDIMLSWAKRS